MPLTHREARKRRLRMAEAVRRGDSITRVAANFQVTSRTVRYACDEHGVQLEKRPVHVRTLVILAALLDARKHKTGETLEAIGERLGGLPKQRISQVAMEAVRLGLLSVT